MAIKIVNLSYKRVELNQQDLYKLAKKIKSMLTINGIDGDVKVV